MPKAKSKVKKCQFVAAGAMLLGLIFMQNAAFAVTFDLQPYTSCGSANSTHAFCYTALDVSVLGLSTNKINALKTVNITNFLNKQGTFYNMKYAWIGNVLNVSGYIKSGTDNYYDFTAGGDTYHPWWNASSSSIFPFTMNFTTPDTTNSNVDAEGVEVYVKSVANTVCKLNNSVAYSTATPTSCRVQDKNGTYIATGTISGKVCTFNNETLIPTHEYAILGYNGGAGWNTPYKIAGGFDIDTTYLTAVHGVYNGSGTPFTEDAVTRIWISLSLNCNTTSTNSVWYTNTLTLNGVSSNVTNYTSTPLNITAVTNLTGAPVLAWLNGTLSINSTNSGTNTSTIGVGLWNITAFFGNTSTNETITWWATYSAPPAFVYNYTYTICTDNSTLLWHDAKFLNGTFNYTDTYELCFNGCDNVTYSCAPAAWQNTAVTLGIVVLIAIAMAAIWRWTR